MAREIKFRAWDIDNKEFVYISETVDGEIWVNNGVTTVTMPEHKGPYEQYTGLKDKNSVEIYEGDIVFFFTEHFDKSTGGFDGEDEHNATVEWFDNGFAFIDKIPYDPNIECEVIGNIHENPELLKE